MMESHVLKEGQALCLAGPTASGKSRLALDLAQVYPLTLINTDSLQVYRDMPTLTALPSLQDQAQCPHKLYGFLSPEEPFSVYEWLQRAEEAYLESLERQRYPVFVGGTGLYFKALVEGFTRVPRIEASIRQDLKATLDREGLSKLYQSLLERDPQEARRLHPQDTARVLRSLEVLLGTGKPLSWWQEQPPIPSFLQHKPFCIVLLPERTSLYARAEKRFDHMMAKGALKEVQGLLDSGQEWDSLPVRKALGAKALASFLRQEISLEAAVTRAKQETRRYIKRQITWFRHQCRGASFFADSRLCLSQLLKIFEEGWKHKAPSA